MRSLLPLALLAVPLLASAGFEASSHKKTSRTGASPYEASAALDGNVATAWIVDPEVGAKGQWIYVDVPTGKVNGVEVVIGWGRDDESWSDHQRLKKATLEVIDLEKGVDGEVVHTQEVSFEDKKGPQAITLPSVAVGGEMAGGRVKIVVDEVYPGQDFEYLALGEVLVVMDEFDAMTVNITQPPSSEDPEHDGSNLTDDNTRTFWASGGVEPGTTLTFDGGRYSVSSIGLTAGPKTHARPKTIKVTQSGSTVEATLADKTGPQWVRLPALVGYTGSGVGPVTVEIVDVYEGSQTNQVALSEVDFKATMLEMF